MLPSGITVLERGWLSSNNVILHGATPEEGAVLIDTGYATHADQTLELVHSAVSPGETVRLIANTHLHSDHCGGNAALVEKYGCPIHIPPGEFEAASSWDEAALSFKATGQRCARFTPAGKLLPGRTLHQGDREWRIHAAPGHDPHSVILFEPGSRTLISADALWEKGFGIVFPELDGTDAFDEVDATLDLIEELSPALVIPGHGEPFQAVAAALQLSRSRLAHYRRHPDRHAASAIKALMVFHMLETQRCSRVELNQWLDHTPIATRMRERYWPTLDTREWSSRLVAELIQAGTLWQSAEHLFAARVK